MNLISAMEYATHADVKKESVVALIKWRNHYCMFNLTYEPEPIDEPPFYNVEYVGGKLNDIYSVEGEYYCGENYAELKEDLLDVVSPDQLKFRVYKLQINTEFMVPFIYHQLLPDLIPDYDDVEDKQFYQQQVDRTLQYINRD